LFLDLFKYTTQHITYPLLIEETVFESASSAIHLQIKHLSLGTMELKKKENN